MSNKFHGIIPPVITPITEKGTLDQLGMGKLIDFLVDSEVNGLLFLGSSGEFSQMSFEERKEAALFAVNYVNGRVPVLIGTGSSSTREAILLSKHAEEIGADGVLVVNPYYWPLTEENLYKYYSQIAEAVNIPILLYNFPELTGQDLGPDFVLKLVDQYSNIVGIKETIDKAGHIREMILKVKKKHPEFSVLSGYDDHLVNTLALGGDGGIPSSANFAPELTMGIYKAFQDKNLEEVMTLHQRLAYLPLLFKLDSPFTNVIKEAVRQMGLEISTAVLPPGQALSEGKKGEVTNILKQAGLLKTLKL
jgi:4-hydroxy-tetrahydrodipicolinate synthase